MWRQIAHWNIRNFPKGSLPYVTLKYYFPTVWSNEENKKMWFIVDVYPPRFFP